MTPDLARLSDRDVLGLTLFGESRGESIEGRIAVANVIRNRVIAQRDGFGRTLRGVCLKPFQFSCWNPDGGDANHTLLLDTAGVLLAPDPHVGPLLRECLWIAEGLIGNAFTDNVKGATHYLTHTLYTTAPPPWAVLRPLLATIGSHVFLRSA